MQTVTNTLQALASRANPEAIALFLEESLRSRAEMNALLSDGEAGRIAAGHGHTLREVAQQPFVWADTALRASEFVKTVFLPRRTAGIFRSIAMVGSGSSHYVGELAAPAIQKRLGMPVLAVPAGNLLTHGKLALPLPEPVLMVSIARSGNSPESVAAIRIAASEAPQTQFLHITCNPEGRLARPEPSDPRAAVLALHPSTNDQSLVMTSSFTSLTLAALAIGYADAPAHYLEQAERLSTDIAALFPELLLAAVTLPYAEASRAVFLGSGCQYGAAREAALKLTEMSAGGVVAMAETHLGLRHGPMAALNSETLIVSFTPPSERPARYAKDLAAELDLKQLGCATAEDQAGAIPVRYRESLPPDATAGRQIDEGFAAIENVVFGQMIGFFACRDRGLRPDAPSAAGVITRVVPPFPIYDDIAPVSADKNGSERADSQ